MIEVLAGEHSPNLRSQCPLLRGSQEVLHNLVQFQLSLEEMDFLGFVHVVELALSPQVIGLTVWEWM